MKKTNLADLILRFGLAFVFFYAGIAAFIEPNSWIGYVPNFIGNKITRAYALHLHSLINVMLGLWLLSGKKKFYAGIVSCIVLFFIIIFNLNNLDIIFRDIGILLSALALCFLNKKN